MTRIFVSPEHIEKNCISIHGDSARHLALVLRSNPGDAIEVHDGQGMKYECRLVSVHKKEIKAEIISSAPCSVESPLNITLAQGIAKGEKMDFIVQKATELGVNGVIPVISERSQVRHTEKVERWKRIALSASQQSGRDRVPEISNPVSLSELLALTDSGSPGSMDEAQGRELKLIFSESKQERVLREVLKSHHKIKNCILFIGPEGGLSPDEVSSAVKAGFIEVSLGPRILRTETAPLTALSILQYELGDMG